MVAMFRLRPAGEGDINSLCLLAQKAQLFNLPRNRKDMEAELEHSVHSFGCPHERWEENSYIFVLEDEKGREIIGCSMIHGLLGTPEMPHLFLEVKQDSHGLETLTFKSLTRGYSEIGGLFLTPSHRGHPEKLGKQLSYGRFLYMGLHRENFTETIHVELMPPLDGEDNSPLWEALGGRFIPMSYAKADALSYTRKDFVLDQFPPGPHRVADLPRKAQEVIGKVREETRPVQRMLERVGFTYTGEVDPFDGGPHYRCPLANITLIREMKKLALKRDSSLEERDTYMASPLDTGAFEARLLRGTVRGDTFVTDEKIWPALSQGGFVAVIPF